MFGRLRHLISATAAFFSLAAVVWAGSGYLPAVGPVSLRFRALPEETTLSTNAVTAAPIPPPVSFIALPPEEPSQTNDFDSVPSMPVVVPRVGEPYTAEAQSPAPQPSPAANPVVSPEMLVKYFAKPGSTNSSPTAGSSPEVGFMPPLLEAKPQSRETP
ncbi:MAG TPA: hypothetical protein VH619_13405 [Verrucomicrobiae bacterium]|jgi:hypothetical protein|nr:hypothetical protein [Verrucomicrobiae bacterium]